MDKTKAIEYLENQKSKIDQSDFDLDSWAGSVAGILDGIFGRGNNFSSQIKALDYDYVMSYEELYPKKVVDLEKSRPKFSNLISEIIDQITILNESDFKQSGNHDSETLKTVVNALRNSLTGRQIADLKEIADKNKGSETNNLLLEKIRNYDIDITQSILVEILSSKEIWERMS